MTNIIKFPPSSEKRIITPEEATRQDDPMHAIMSMFASMEEGFAGAFHEIQNSQFRMGQAIDVDKLTIALLVGILLEKKIFTREEFEVLYKEKVIDVMAKQMEKIREQIQEKINEQEAKESDSE